MTMKGTPAVALSLCIGLLLAVQRCACQITLFRQSPETVYGMEGETVTLKCGGSVLSGQLLAVLSWRKDNIFISNSSNAMAITGTSAATNAVISTLTISNARPLDRGWYSCVGQNTQHFAAVDFNVDIQEPVKILSTAMRSLQVVMGSQVLLPCIVTGYPSPSISWSKDGVALTASKKIGIDSSLGWLTVEAVNSLDEGNYTCTASSTLKQLDSAQHTVIVLIEAPQAGRGRPVSFNASVTQARINEVVRIPATILPATTGPIAFLWEQDGVVVRTEQTLAGTAGRVIQVALPVTVTSLADAGVYTVVVDGNNTAVAGALDVISDPVVTPFTAPKLFVIATTPTRRAYVGCRVTGRPAPALSLASSGITIGASSSTGLILATKSVLASDDAVTYVCTGGTQTASISLDQINSCGGSSTNHITNPTGTMAPNVAWNTSQPVGLGGTTLTGNRYFTVTARPGLGSGSLSRYMKITIGLAIVSFSFRMRVEASSGSAGAQAVATMDFLQRGPAELPVSDAALHQRVFTTTSEQWTWIHQNISAPPDSLVRGVKLTLSTQLRANATASVTADFDSFCVRFFVLGTAKPAFVSQFATSYPVYINYPITLDCSAEGKPTPTYAWTRNGSPVLGQTSSKFTFTPLSKLEAGRYGCTATVTSPNVGIIGTRVQSTLVLVNEVTQPSVLPTDFNSTDAVKLKAVNLTCPITGAPLSFTWLKGVSVVTNVPGRVEWSPGSSVLTVYSAVLNDAGVYECRANNTAGTANAFVTLRVFTAPEIQAGRNLNNSKRISLGTRVTLLCPLVGDPEPDITWYVGGVNAITLNSLDAVVNTTAKALYFHFTGAFPDPTLITCVGTNSYGVGGPVRFTLGTTVAEPTTAVTPTTTATDIVWYKRLDPYGLLEYWIWICILAGVLVLLLLLIICCCRYCQKRKTRTLTPVRGALQYSSQRSDTVRTQAKYQKGAEDISFIALNPVAYNGPPEPPMSSHPSQSGNPYQPNPVQNGGPPPPSYNATMSAVTLGAAAGASGAPPPLPSMNSHPALQREASQRAATRAPLDLDEEIDTQDYLVPEGEDEMASRPPAPVPGAMGGGGPAESPLAPLMQQQQQDYVNVEARPPAPLPGTENYENFNP
ncbi:hemicentin-2-like [Sycon ciliatum]|uniref:hemicentin-2-like n=1 Tax=Sycon ciliatum TaxID=27933 RepID=UPI0031F64597